MVHMMIDIETLDTTSRAVVVQVGWCLFNPETIGDPVEVFPSLEEQLEQGRTVSASTLRWWMVAQSQAARERVFDPLIEVSVEDLARKIRDTIRDYSVEFVWSHGPHFDMAILIDLLGDEVFDYRSPRDTRTLAMLAPNALKPPPLTKHSAGDDAYSQAQWVQNCWRTLGYRGG